MVIWRYRRKVAQRICIAHIIVVADAVMHAPRSAEKCLQGWLSVHGDDPRPRDPGFREGKVHDDLPLHLANPARVIEGGYKVIRARRRAESDGSNERPERLCYWSD